MRRLGDPMNRRTFLKAASVSGLVARGSAPAVFGYSPQHASQEQTGRNGSEQERQPTGKSPEQILLKDYRPKSIYKIPATEVAKARYPIIDMHSHPYAKTPAQISEWVGNMDEVGVEKTVILTSTVGREFDAIYRQYSKYPERFEVWCGLDFTAYDRPGFGSAALRELERCYRTGARGVGELHDKGQGMASGKSKTQGLHPDDSRMDSMFEKCAELGLPISIHVADPIWMYQKMDRTNDGLMNAYHWRLDNQPNIVGLTGMIEILERTIQKHPLTTFIACHFANLDYDLARLGHLFDRNPNLYADISARYAETAPIPRFVSQFYAEHSDRLLYGTDMGFDRPMYRVTFRILESLDEHFYETAQFDYHWSLNGFGLPDSTLQRVYHDNAAKILASHPAKPR
jgi:predicted TIM-barrel fold metal-dependent hydrolase